MDQFLTVLAVVEGVVIGVLSLLLRQRTRQVLSEREQRVKSGLRNLRLRVELKKKLNEEKNEDMSDEEADRALDRVLGVVTLPKDE